MASIPVTTPARPPLQVYIVVLMGAVAVSFAAIFIRLAQAEHVPSLLIAAARLTIAALVLTPVVLRNHLPEIRALKRSDLVLALVSGLFLALHFATWILSLEYTSVLISVVLVTTNPLWVALLEVIFLRAHLGRTVIIGLLIGFAGSLVAGLSSSGGASLGKDPLLGSVLAFTGAVCVAIYLVIGRKLRGRLSLLPYIWLVYGCGALILLAAVILTHIPITGYSSQGYVWLIALALIPQLIGHSSFNYALKYLPATLVGIVNQLEPVLSAVAAIFVFQEIPGQLQLAGSAAILAGVILASIGQSSDSRR
ncbi:MAG: DMT family transporter [Chloroflexota bacterium]